VISTDALNALYDYVGFEVEMMELELWRGQEHAKEKPEDVCQHCVEELEDKIASLQSALDEVHKELMDRGELVAPDPVNPDWVQVPTVMAIPPEKVRVVGITQKGLVVERD
jgi:hypothetical protein